MEKRPSSSDVIAPCRLTDCHVLPSFKPMLQDMVAPTSGRPSASVTFPTISAAGRRTASTAAPARSGASTAHASVSSGDRAINISE